VRNLIAGKPLAKGTQRIAWDGLDEAGRVVPPGQYRWRAISHPGLAPEYLFSFGNDGTPPWRTGSGQDMWGPDHSTLQAAAAGKDWTFFAGSVAESGYPIVAVDQAGTKQQHYIAPMGTGIETVQLATAGQTLFAAHDGFVWGDHIDKHKPDWKGAEKLTLCRFDIPSGKLIEFPGGKKFIVIATTEVGPGSANPQFTGHALAGLAALGDRLYLSNRATNTLLVLDAKTAEKVGELKLDQPGALAADGGNLLAVSGKSLVRLNPTTGTATPLKLDAPPAAIAGLAVDTAENIFVSDPATHVVRVFDKTGRSMKTLGKPGGDYAGPVDPLRLVNPRGLAVAANGWLWVTEDRWTPKRLTAWDVAGGKLVREKFGPTKADCGNSTLAKNPPTCARSSPAIPRATRASCTTPFCIKTGAPSSSASARPRRFASYAPTVRSSHWPRSPSATRFPSRTTGGRRRRSSTPSTRPTPRC
jgi:hypothetical protein